MPFKANNKVFFFYQIGAKAVWQQQQEVTQSN
jgi:hypothetical protein